MKDSDSRYNIYIGSVNDDLSGDNVLWMVYGLVFLTL